MPKLTPDRLAALIAIYFIALGVRYSFHTPIFEGPDELAHFVYTHRILTDGGLPIIPPRDVAFAERHFEVHQMPLYYLTGTPFIAGFQRDDVETYYRMNPFASIGTVTGNNEHIIIHPLAHTGDTVYAVWALRMMSLMMGTVSLLCVYHSGRLVWDERLGLGAMLLAASIPMFIHISTSINNDNLNITFGSLGVFLSLRNWQRGEIRRRDMIYLALVIGLVSITKLTGLAAVGFILAAHLMGGIIGRYTWREIAEFLAFAVAGFLILGAWYYIRSIILYDDPIAYDETRALWGRMIDLPTEFELWGVWESFWMTLGHLNVPSPIWFSRYVTVMSIISMVGVLVMFVRRPEYRWRILYIFLVTLVVWGMMIYVTRRVNISQGRAVMPSIAAAAPLLVLGWRSLLGKRLFVLPILPIAAMAMVAPFSALDERFEWLEPISPEQLAAAPINRLDARAETITVHGYHLRNATVAPDGRITLDVYFSGGNPENPVLFVTAQHPLTGRRLGTLNEYPGMVATDTLHADETYRATMSWALNEPPTNNAPFQIELALGWRVPDPDDPGQGRYLDWFNQNDEQIGGVFFRGPVYVDPSYTPPSMTQATDVTFGGVIGLRGYTLEPVGDDDTTLTVDLLWQRLAPIDRDLTLTVGILDESGALIAQQDQPPAGYPTSSWVDTPPFMTQHVLDIPADAVSDGALQLRLGWYAPDTLERLAVVGSETVQDDLVLLPLER